MISEKTSIIPFLGENSTLTVQVQDHSITSVFEHRHSLTFLTNRHFSLKTGNLETLSCFMQENKYVFSTWAFASIRTYSLHNFRQEIMFQYNYSRGCPKMVPIDLHQTVIHRSRSIRF